MANLTISTIVNLNKSVGRRRSEKPVLDGDDELMEESAPLVLAMEASAASAADLAEVRAIVPPPASAAGAAVEISSLSAVGRSDSVVFSESSSSLAILWIVSVILSAAE